MTRERRNGPVGNTSQLSQAITPPRDNSARVREKRDRRHCAVVIRQMLNHVTREVHQTNCAINSSSGNQRAVGSETTDRIAALPTLTSVISSPLGLKTRITPLSLPVATNPSRDMEISVVSLVPSTFHDPPPA